MVCFLSCEFLLLVLLQLLHLLVGPPLDFPHSCFDLGLPFLVELRQFLSQLGVVAFQGFVGEREPIDDFPHGFSLLPVDFLEGFEFPDDMLKLSVFDHELGVEFFDCVLAFFGNVISADPLFMEELVSNDFCLAKPFLQLCVFVDEFVVMLQNQIHLEFEILDLFLLYGLFCGGMLLTGEVAGSMGRDCL